MRSRRRPALFAAFFDRCDLAALKGMVTDDFEMFHDKGGLHDEVGPGIPRRTSRAPARARKPARTIARAASSVPGTLKVYPLNNYGAVEVGVHRFYQLLPGKPEKLVEVSLFTHVWKKERARLEDRARTELRPPSHELTRGFTAARAVSAAAASTAASRHRAAIRVRCGGACFFDHRGADEFTSGTFPAPIRAQSRDNRCRAGIACPASEIASTSS